MYFFSICEQFLISLKEAGMKVSIPDLLQQWYELEEYAKKILSLAGVSYLVWGIQQVSPNKFTKNYKISCISSHKFFLAS